MIVNKNLAEVTQAVSDLYWEDDVNVARINRIVQYILGRDNHAAAEFAPLVARAEQADRLAEALETVKPHNLYPCRENAGLLMGKYSMVREALAAYHAATEAEKAHP